MAGDGTIQSHVVVLFIFGSLMGGALIRHVLKDSRIPYTVWLLLYGMLVGLLVTQFEDFLGALHHSARIVADMDPHLMLYIFLPPLIFESAFSIDYNVFLKNIYRSVTLAVPVLLLSVMCVGSLTKWVLYPDWSWTECLLFGSILSATDPVAVVSLLKTLGASRPMTSLIESESLLNDGTAVVIFSTLLEAVQAGSFDKSPGEVVGQFLYMALGGVAFGAICAVLVLLWISFVFNDPAVEITITLSSAYLVFYWAEANLHVSGVLAVVTFGLGFARSSASRISPEIQHFLHEFWCMLEYLANTLVFVLTGLIIVLKNAFPDSSDFLKLMLLYTALTMIRTIMCFGVSPLFKRMAYVYTWKEALLCSWCGLRGSVSLALALVVKLDPRIEQSHRESLLFQVAGIVILTLVVNGSTTGILVEALGMLKQSDIKRQMKVRAWMKLQKQLEDDIDELKKSPFYCNANWTAVRLIAAFPTDLKQGRRRTLLPGHNKVRSTKSLIKHQTDVWVDMRSRLLSSLKSCLYDQYSHGMIGPQAIEILSHATASALDITVCDTVLPWEQFGRYTSVRPSRFQYIPILKRLAFKRVYSRLALGIDVANGFRTAHETVRKFLDDSHLVDDVRMLQKLQGLLNEEIDKAQSILYDLYTIFPEIYISISTRHSARMLLHNQRKKVKQLRNKGLISSDEAQEWTRYIEGQMKKVRLMSAFVNLPTRDEILKEIPWVKSLSVHNFQKLSSVVVPVIFNKDEFIVKQDDVGKHVFVISRGLVSVLYNHHGKHIRIQDIGVGTTVGEISLLRGCTRSASVQANGTVLAFRLSFKDMYAIMQQDDSVATKMWRHACWHLAEGIFKIIPEYAFMNETRGRLRLFVKKWTIHKVRGPLKVEKKKQSARGETYELTKPILLAHGYAIQYVTGADIELMSETPHVFDPTESSTPSPSSPSQFQSMRGSLRSGLNRSGTPPKTVFADPLLRSETSRVYKSPCFFKATPGLSIFVYEKSQIMQPPVNVIEDD